VITRVNGEGVRHIYDGYLIVQDRKERTDELVAEYTYFQGNIFKIKRGTTERWVYNYPEGGWPRHLFDNEGTRTDSIDMGWFGDVAYRYGTSDIGIGWAGGWTFAYDTAMPFVFIAETNEIWLPKIGKRLNPIVRHSSTVNLMDSAWLGPTTPSKCDETSPTRGPVIHVGGTIRLSDSKCVSPFWKWFRKLFPRRARPTCADTKPKTPIPPGDTPSTIPPPVYDPTIPSPNPPQPRKTKRYGDSGDEGDGESGLGDSDKPEWEYEGYKEARDYDCPYIDQFPPKLECWPPLKPPYDKYREQWVTLIDLWPPQQFYEGKKRTSCARTKPTIDLFLDSPLDLCKHNLNNTLYYSELKYERLLCISLPKDVCSGRPKDYWLMILGGALPKEAWGSLNYLMLVYSMACRDRKDYPLVSKLRIPVWDPIYNQYADDQAKKLKFAQCVLHELLSRFETMCS